jgi:4-carboxymuconolactone decarboxylase
MARLPPKTREEFSVEQQEAHDMYTDVCHRSFGPNGKNFIYAESNGALMGPFSFFISHPEVGKRLWDLMFAFSKLPLPADVREVGILTAAAQFGESYVGYSHVPLAVNTGSLSLEQAQSLKKGEKPGGLTEQCSVAFDVARSLCGDRGPLPAALWDRAVEVLGKETTLALLHYIGFYSYVSVAMNGVETPIPK